MRPGGRLPAQLQSLAGRQTVQPGATLRVETAPLLLHRAQAGSTPTSRLGTRLGDYRQNHLDEVNQVAGFRDLFAADPVTLYRQQAIRLKQLGL